MKANAGYFAFGLLASCTIVRLSWQFHRAGWWKAWFDAGIDWLAEVAWKIAGML